MKIDSTIGIFALTHNFTLTAVYQRKGVEMNHCKLLLSLSFNEGITTKDAPLPAPSVHSIGLDERSSSASTFERHEVKCEKDFLFAIQTKYPLFLNFARNASTENSSGA